MSSEPEAGGDHNNSNNEAVEMLTHGRGLAFQLRDLLLQDDGQIPVSGDRLVLAEDLLDKIHGSFTHSISALDRQPSSGNQMNHEESQSGESSKSRRSSSASLPRAAAASRRRRREISQGESWTEITSTLVHDGHAWRKYGQKPILNSNYSRNYYRCTHKDQLGCPAKKHVQQIGDDPLTYRTVYTFSHTCTMMSNTKIDAPATQMIFESASAAQPADMNLASSSIILNFQSNQHESNHNNYNTNVLMKQEYTLLNDQQTQDHHTSVQRLTADTNNCNLGSSSAVGRDASHYMDDFTDCYTDFSPFVSYSEDTDQDPPWS